MEEKERDDRGGILGCEWEGGSKDLWKGGEEKVNDLRSLWECDLGKGEKKISLFVHLFSQLLLLFRHPFEKKETA